MSPRLVLIILIAAAILCGVMAATTAQEQRPGCAPEKEFVETLQRQFNEFRVLDLDLKTARGKFTITRSTKGTWTILAVEGEDYACIFAAGETSVVDRGI